MLKNQRTLSIILIDIPKRLMLFDKLNHQAKILLTLAGLYSLSLGLSSIFINLFLYKVDSSFYQPMLFNLGTYLALMVGFIIGGILLKKISLSALLGISFVLFSIFFATLVLLGSQSANFALSLGLLYGFSGGFFWLVRHLLEYEDTIDGNRNRFFAAAYIVATLTTIIAPIIAGFFIIAGEAQNYSGYLIVFAISSLLMLLAGIISFMLKKEVGLEFNLSDLIHLDKYNKDWFSIEITQFIQGLKEGSGPILVTLVSFLILKNELNVGGAVSLGAALSLISGYFIGKYIKPSQRIIIGRFSAVLTVLAYLILSWSFNITGLFFYILIMGLAAPALYIVFDTIDISSIDSDPRGRERRAIYLTSSEIWWDLGRITSLLIFLILINFYNGIETTRYFLFFSSLVIPLIIYLYSRFNSQV